MYGLELFDTHGKWQAQPVPKHEIDDGGQLLVSECVWEILYYYYLIEMVNYQ